MYNTLLTVSYEDNLNTNDLVELGEVLNRAGIENLGLVSYQCFFENNEFISGVADYGLTNPIDENEIDYYESVIQSFLKDKISVDWIFLGSFAV